MRLDASSSLFNTSKSHLISYLSPFKANTAHFNIVSSPFMHLRRPLTPPLCNWKPSRCNMTLKKGNMALTKGNMALTKGYLALCHVRKSWMKHCFNASSSSFTSPHCPFPPLRCLLAPLQCLLTLIHRPLALFNASRAPCLHIAVKRLSIVF